jgi:hypothetical protein
MKILRFFNQGSENMSTSMKKVKAAIFFYPQISIKKSEKILDEKCEKIFIMF